jgi:hypothetical protein
MIMHNLNFEWCTLEENEIMWELDQCPSTWTFDHKIELKSFNLIINMYFNKIPFNSS